MPLHVPPTDDLSRFSARNPPPKPKQLHIIYRGTLRDDTYSAAKGRASSRVHGRGAITIFAALIGEPRRNATDEEVMFEEASTRQIQLAPMKREAWLASWQASIARFAQVLLEEKSNRRLPGRGKAALEVRGYNLMYHSAATRSMSSMWRVQPTEGIQS